MKKVTILGIGLIGGSLALCLKDHKDVHVIGHARRQETIDTCLYRGIIDEGTTSLEAAVSDADFIFICVPVSLLPTYLEKLNQLPLKKGCIISDVGSTKQTIVSSAKVLQHKDVYFIGGHPMAGSERTGVDAASSYLFENAFYVLTPLEDTPVAVYEQLESLLQFTKAKIVKLDAKMHDEVVGAISHLPHIIAAGLVYQVSQYHENNDWYGLLAAGGFRDITRIASSDPVIWRDILMNNREVLIQLLDDWHGQMEDFKQWLEAADSKQIEERFEAASRFRNSLPEKRKGAITSLYDLYVDIPDHPGVIGEITSQLGAQLISLSNIEIIESRAEVPGVLRISFQHQHEFDAAIKLLKQLNYDVHI
ncbi:prephenate dehydrogenase [Longirhabdus pacifica]|uniref:prephenate dehydrogenase n=1 Tax=Longirhabdus pacifica TaxID=2305227 RepID=UPI0010092CE8|nr:prephenate dehydrogenase [Longirhabdus pacifica]